MNLEDTFKSFQEEAFRLELLPAYDVEGERDEFAAYLDGAFVPRRDRSAWLGNIVRTTQAGRTWRRVHVVAHELPVYVRFEIEWGYVRNADAGEEVFLLSAEKFSALDLGDVKDFWLFDHRSAFEMNYDEGGKYLGNRELVAALDVDRCRRVRQKVLDGAVPLRAFLKEYRTRTTMW